VLELEPIHNYTETLKRKKSSDEETLCLTPIGELRRRGPREWELKCNTTISA